MNRRQLLFACLVLTLLFSSMAMAQRVPVNVQSKVDAALLSASERLAAGDPVRSKSVVMLDRDSPDPIFHVLVLVKDESVIERLAREGFEIGSAQGNIATAFVRASQLPRLAADGGVEYIEGGYKLFPDLNMAIPDARVDVVQGYKVPPQNTADVDGSRVIIGATDSGINFNHEDFKTDPANTSTRTIWLWDQVDNSGTPPSGQGFNAAWNYGSLYTQAQMNAGTCPHKDTNGHGTHVMGIAAGDGSATGNSQPAYTYVGAAPGADLIMVKNQGGEFWDYTGFYASPATTLNAYGFIRSAAENLGLPHVINTSQGTNMGPHDGTTIFEQGINTAVANNSVIVVSAGNNGNTGVVSGAKHTTGTVPVAGTLTLDAAFNSTWGWPAGLDCWYSANDRLNLTVVDSWAVSHGPFTPTGGVQTFTVDGRTNTVTPTVNASINGQNRWLIEIADNTDGDPSNYLWQFIFSPTAGNALPDGGQVFCWFERNYLSFWVPGSPGAVRARTLGMPACAQDAITVAAHTSRTSYVDVNGNTQTVSGTVGNIAAFSSAGPTRTGAFQKPEISAPGHIVGSTRSADATFSNSSIAQDGKHTFMSGTSMSSPMVAGAVALMLQKNAWTGGGTVTPAMIKQSLLNTARSDAGTGAVPNNDFGYGKLSADAAWNNVPTDAGVQDFRAVVAKGSTVELTWAVTDDIDYVGFEIYRAASVFSGWTRINDALIAREGDTYSYMDTSIPLGQGHYLYMIKTVGSGGDIRPRASTKVDFGRLSREAADQRLLEEVTLW